jgi:putative sterol carrier protein
MSHPVFSAPWAAACAAAINGAPAYRAAASTWEGAVMLEMLPEDGAQSLQQVFFDLWHGECRAARIAAPADADAARYVLSGSTSAWEQVLSGRVAPLLAVMSGKLKLTRGSLGELLPYVNAAKELVSAVASVPGVFGGSRE